MEWKTTETNLSFHFKGIMFNMNEYLFIRMFIKIHYYLLFNLFHHFILPVSLSKIFYFLTMPTQIYKKYFRDIQVENTPFTFQWHTNISDETVHICYTHNMQWILWGWSKSGRYVAFETVYLFKLTDFRNQPIGVMWLRTRTVVCSVVMCEFITVWKRSCRKDNVLTSVCHSVHREDASKGRQVPYGIYPPLNTDSQWAGMQ